MNQKAQVIVLSQRQNFGIALKASLRFAGIEILEVQRFSEIKVLLRNKSPKDKERCIAFIIDQIGLDKDTVLSMDLFSLEKQNHMNGIILGNGEQSISSQETLDKLNIFENNSSIFLYYLDLPLKVRELIQVLELHNYQRFEFKTIPSSLVLPGVEIEKSESLEQEPSQTDIKSSPGLNDFLENYSVDSDSEVDSKLSTKSTKDFEHQKTSQHIVLPDVEITAESNLELGLDSSQISADLDEFYPNSNAGIVPPPPNFLPEEENFGDILVKLTQESSKNPQKEVFGEKSGDDESTNAEKLSIFSSFNSKDPEFHPPKPPNLPLDFWNNTQLGATFQTQIKSVNELFESRKSEVNPKIVSGTNEQTIKSIEASVSQESSLSEEEVQAAIEKAVDQAIKLKDAIQKKEAMLDEEKRGVQLEANAELAKKREQDLRQKIIDQQQITDVLREEKISLRQSMQLEIEHHKKQLIELQRHVAKNKKEETSLFKKKIAEHKKSWLMEKKQLLVELKEEQSRNLTMKLAEQDSQHQLEKEILEKEILALSEQYEVDLKTSLESLAAKHLLEKQLLEDAYISAQKKYELDFKGVLQKSYNDHKEEKNMILKKFKHQLEIEKEKNHDLEFKYRQEIQAALEHHQRNLQEERRVLKQEFEDQQRLQQEEYENKILSLSAVIKNLEIQIQKHVHSEEVLKAAEKQLRDSLEQLKKQLEEEVMAHEVEINIVKKDFEAAQKQVLATEQSLQDLEQELLSAHQNLKNVQEIKEQQTEKLQDLEKQLSALNLEILEVRKKSEDYISQNRALNVEIRDLKRVHQLNEQEFASALQKMKLDYEKEGQKIELLNLQLSEKKEELQEFLLKFKSPEEIEKREALLKEQVEESLRMSLQAELEAQRQELKKQESWVMKRFSYRHGFLAAQNIEQDGELQVSSTLAWQSSEVAQLIGATDFVPVSEEMPVFTQPAVEEMRSLEVQSGRFFNGELAALLWSAHYLQISGALSLTHPEGGKRTLFLEYGEITAFDSDMACDRVEDILLRASLISAQKYAELKVASKQSARRLCSQLVDEKILKNHELFSTVQHCLQEQIYSIFEWESGEYAYEKKLAHASDRSRLKISLPELLTIGIRRKYDEARLWNVLGGPASLLAPDQRAMSLPQLTAEEREVIPYFDGARPLEEIVLASGVAVEVALRTALILLSSGNLCLVVRGMPVKHEEKIKKQSVEIKIDKDRIIEKLRQAREEHYYVLLGLKTSASEFEIAQRAELLLLQFNPDRFHDFYFRSLKKELKEICEVIVDAKAVLLNENLRKIYIYRHFGEEQQQTLTPVVEILSA